MAMAETAKGAIKGVYESIFERRKIVQASRPIESSKQKLLRGHKEKFLPNDVWGDGYDLWNAKEVGVIKTDDQLNLVIRIGKEETPRIASLEYISSDIREDNTILHSFKFTEDTDNRKQIDAKDLVYWEISPPPKSTIY